MTRRTLLMLMIVVGVVGILGAVKTLQIQAAIAQASSFAPPPEAVTTIKVRAEEWPASLSAIGTVHAVRGVTVSADLPGVVESITFESGRPVREGEVLVRLDTRQERAQLAAAESQRDLLRLNLDRARGLVSQGIVAQADLDRATAEHQQAEARVGEIRATIDRKQIRAPFAGVLGIRQVNLGQYLNAGDPIVPLQSLDPLHVLFSVPQQQLAQVRVGSEVQVTTEGQPGAAAAGRVTAINSVVDEATRNVQVEATLENPGGRLRPGMFVQARVVVGEASSVLTPARLGDQLRALRGLGLRRGRDEGRGGSSYTGVRQQFVKLGAARGDQVAVVSGVEPGAEVVTSGAFKLRNGAAVQVNNEVQPSNDPAPKPEDN